MIIKGFPSDRLTLARHFPGACSKAFTISCLYSTADPQGSREQKHTRDLTKRNSTKTPQLGDFLLLWTWLSWPLGAAH